MGDGVRRSHLLKSNRMGEKPSHIIFADTETRSENVTDNVVEATLWFGWACYVRRLNNQRYSKPDWVRFDSQSAFWRFVISKAHAKRRVYVFTHNLSFDTSVLDIFSNMESAGFRLTRAIVDDPPTVLAFRRDFVTIVLVDSLNLFRMPLAKLGEALGVPKLAMPKEDAPKALWDIYCKTDVEILRQSILNYIEVLQTDDLGNFQITLPSQAFTAFRHRFMTHEILIDDNEKALQIAREGYMGGRTEAFYLGETPENVYVMDINSQYPFVMGTTPMPIKLRSVWKRVSLDELRTTIIGNSVVARVRLKTDIAAFPFRFGGHLVFPIGHFDTTLCTPEIELALELGVLESVHEMAVYEQAVIFKDYMDYFYTKRLEARRVNNGVLDLTYKLFMNSLYGKFGQSGRVFTDIGQADDLAAKTWLEHDVVTGETYNVRQIGTLLQREKRDGESTHSSPAISAHVTSAGRVLLWRYILTAEPRNVFYCDTDSLMVTYEGYKRLSGLYESTTMGALKLEHRMASLVIRGVKDYVLDGVTKIKGIRKNAIQLAPNVYQQETFRGFKGMLRDGELDRQLIKTGTKTLSRIYYKGTVLPSGVIEPLQIDTTDGLTVR